MDLFTEVYTQIGNLLSPEWYRTHWVALLNIIMIDVTLAGDNAIVVGLAASRVAPSFRARVIFWGIVGAVVLRVLFSGVAQQLMQVIGLTLAGGLLLLFVAWRMYREIVAGNHAEAHAAGASPNPGAPSHTEMGFWSALWTIVLADVSMSLDNVLAVAGASKGEPLVLFIGLAISIVLMAVASNYIAKLLATYPWISWVGLVIIVWVALDMIYTDSHKVTCELYNIGCSETLLRGILHRLGFSGGGGG